MKIAIVIPTLTLGGAEKIALETATGFADEGHDISLIILSNKITLSVPGNIKLYTGINNVFSLLHIINRSHLDYCISYMERANLICAIICKILGIKHCATVHTAPKAGFRLRSWKNRLAIGFTYRLLAYLNVKIVGVCQGIILDLKKLYNINNSYVVPNFIDTNSIVNLANNCDIRDHYDFIFVGRLAHVKGCHIFIEALGKINDFFREKNIKVAILGAGPEGNDIKKRINEFGLQDYITLLGAKKNPYPYIKNSKYIVVPSYAEGFGMVVLESLALGTKVIFSRCDFGPKEIIGNYFKEFNSLGFEDPSVDPEVAITELSNIIYQLIASELESETDESSLRQRVDFHYGKVKVCKAFLDTLGK